MEIKRGKVRKKEERKGRYESIKNETWKNRKKN